jgi:cytochrome c-type biogenesis protein CcmH/NrfG
VRKRQRVQVTAWRSMGLGQFAGRMALCGAVLTALAHAALVSAQPTARATCQEVSAREAVSQARTRLQNNPEELGPRLKLADALVDQGCYEDAVAVLEAGQSMYPHDVALTGKLRDVRSMLTEQTYIRGITQAEDAAKQQHNQLRCTQFADVEACNEALRSSPNDSALLLAKADAWMQSGHPADAAGAYQHALQLNPGNESLRAKLAAATARANANITSETTTREASAAASAPRTLRRSRDAVGGETTALKASDASSAATLSTPSTAGNGDAAPATGLAVAAATTSYSNDAPAGKSN